MEVSTFSIQFLVQGGNVDWGLAGPTCWFHDAKPVKSNRQSALFHPWCFAQISWYGGEQPTHLAHQNSAVLGDIPIFSIMHVVRLGEVAEKVLQIIAPRNDGMNLCFWVNGTSLSLSLSYLFLLVSSNGTILTYTEKLQSRTWHQSQVKYLVHTMVCGDTRGPSNQLFWVSSPYVFDISLQWHCMCLMPTLKQSHETTRLVS